MPRGGLSIDDFGAGAADAVEPIMPRTMSRKKPSPGTLFVSRGIESLQTRRWREMDSNF
jgi:hypothetical protein